MRLAALLLIALPAVALASAPTLAAAEWRAANAQVAAAAKNPRIAAALEATNRMDAAILARDRAGFSAVFAEDAVVNNPFNRIARKADAERNLQTGLIDYGTLTRSIEYAAVRGAHDVVLMGEETLTPQGKAKFAGRTVRRRTTEVWSDESGAWKLAIRQATIYAEK
jgi:ketosteroid isomerase-like protein